jgi:hypothetical protein
MRYLVLSALALLLLCDGAIAASDRDKFLRSLNGTWKGTYCQGAGTTTYHFATDRADPWVGEDFCRIICGGLDYVIQNVDPAAKSITLAGNIPTQNYSITFVLQGDGSLAGTYHGHSRCRTAHISKVSSRVTVGKKPAPPPSSSGGRCYQECRPVRDGPYIKQSCRTVCY